MLFNLLYSRGFCLSSFLFNCMSSLQQLWSPQDVSKDIATPACRSTSHIYQEFKNRLLDEMHRDTHHTKGIRTLSSSSKDSTHSHFSLANPATDVTQKVKKHCKLAYIILQPSSTWICERASEREREQTDEKFAPAHTPTTPRDQLIMRMWLIWASIKDYDTLMNKDVKLYSSLTPSGSSDDIYLGETKSWN